MLNIKHYPRITQPPSEGSFFLFGVRGTGKSTWAKQAFPDAHRVDLLDEALYQDLLAEPSLFAAELATLPAGSRVIVDEIQRLPSLLNEVHRHIEDRGLTFILLGSSARKLKRSGTNLLAGRAQWKTMHPLLPEELGRDLSLERILYHGSIALIWNAPEPEAALRAYVQLYLKEEIRAEALVRNLPGFSRFLPVAALCHGQVINIASIARDAGAARSTVVGYLQILEDTLLAIRLPAFDAKLRIRERKHPKLYWVDPGLVRAIKKHSGAPAIEEIGPLFEGWILTLLRAYTAERQLCDEIFYWAAGSGGGTEIDFILRRGNDLLAIEVKSRTRFTGDMIVGLRAFADAPGLTRRILVYRGSRKLHIEGIDILPLETFLDEIREELLWP